jgi:hypothetical protein
MRPPSRRWPGAAGGHDKVPDYCQGLEAEDTKPKKKDSKERKPAEGWNQGQGGPPAGAGGGSQGHGGPPGTSSPPTSNR